MSFDQVDVLDELALYPNRRDLGMSRSELLDALGFDDSYADRLTHVLGALSRAGRIRREGEGRGNRWFITHSGMSYQDPNGWDGEPESWDDFDVVAA